MYVELQVLLVLLTLDVSWSRAVHLGHQGVKLQGYDTRVDLMEAKAICSLLDVKPEDGSNPGSQPHSCLLGMSSPSATTQPELTQRRPGTYTRTGHCRVSAASAGVWQLCDHSGPHVIWDEEASSVFLGPGGPRVLGLL